MVAVPYSGAKAQGSKARAAKSRVLAALRDETVSRPDDTKYPETAERTLPLVVLRVPAQNPAHGRPNASFNPRLHDLGERASASV